MCWVRLGLDKGREYKITKGVSRVQNIREDKYNNVRNDKRQAMKRRENI